jgi:hypothetical protein
MSQKKVKSVKTIKNITIRFEPEDYQKILLSAKSENRSIANFIETSMLENIQEKHFIDEFEMQEILSNQELLKSLEQGHKDAKAKRGRFV